MKYSDYSSEWSEDMLKKELNQYEVVFTEDENWKELEYVRRPYYRMRGKPVTEKQAFDIIRHTDNFFRFEAWEITNHADYIGCLNFDNWLIQKNHLPRGYGWIHVDGTVGTNGITQKYPTVGEFMDEWRHKLMAFPYLDLVIAVTSWDEMSYECEKMLFSNPQEEWDTEKIDGDFYEAVLVGIYVHDKKVEILSKADAVAKYKEYDSLYGKNREMYVPEYYERNGIVQVDQSYLERCIESYGLDAEAVLGRIPGYIWKGKGLEG